MSIQRLSALLLLALGALPLSAAAPPSTGAKVTAPPAKPAPVLEKLEPKNGKWLRDKSGREYYLLEIPRIEGQYVWLDEAHKTIQTRYGTPYEVESSTAKVFRVRIYRAEEVVEKKPAPPAEPPAPLPTLPTTDRIELQDFGRGLPESGQWRDGFVLSDFDGDGALEIVFGSPRRGNGIPIVFKRDAKGQWTRQALKVPRPPFSYDYGDVATADFNGDGRQDIAVASHLRGIVVLVADGKGAFSEWSNGLFFSIPRADQKESGFTSRAIAAADWNGDGRPDLVALGEGPKLAIAAGTAAQPSTGMRVFLNNGDGTWTTLRETEGEGVRAHGLSLSVADLDGDGRPDVLLGSEVLGSTAILRWQKDGGAWDLGDVEAPAKLCLFSSVAIGDVDKDGHPDLLAGTLCRQDDHWVTALQVYNGLGGRRFERHQIWAENGNAKVSAVAAGDLDGDTKVDLVALTGDGRTLAFLGDGNGGFVEKSSPELTLPGCRGYHAEIADFDHDGKGEIVATFAGESSALLAPELCTAQGALKAWSVHTKAPAVP